ncbi:MAG TPA: hypothetical protein VJP02_10335 [Candidatus Sulfotelmatobacter sp.]|nr:hypothetical protein [Candidatus Sulfotelmatobacter sp.]
MISCAVQIGFSGGADGINVSVSFPPQAIFAQKASLSTSCPAETLPACSGSGGACCSGGSTQCTNGVWTCSNGAIPCTGSVPYCGAGQSPQCNCDGNWSCAQNNSPIIIDTQGTGFQLTNAPQGVRFELDPNRGPEQLAWTAIGSRNGWLALPHDGKVQTGKDLFGNFTPQPPSDHPNGFLALAVYDKPDNGGNGDGIIDWHDAVYQKLRVWIDENHDGKAQLGELYTLPSVASSRSASPIPSRSSLTTGATNSAIEEKSMWRVIPMATTSIE